MNTSRARSVETLSQSDADQAGKPTGERLFDIAAALFCEKGYAATTTREIAAAAGIQQASLYYHVTGKEDLCIRSAFLRWSSFFAEVQAAVTPPVIRWSELRSLPAPISGRFCGTRYGT